MRPSTVKVVAIVEGSKAAGVGLAVGDKIVAVDRVTVADSTQLAAALARPGDEKRAAVQRDGTKLELVVTNPAVKPPGEEPTGGK